MGILSTALSALVVTEGLLAGLIIHPASPIFLPPTSCRPGEAQYRRLVVNMSYAAVAETLGCDGVSVRLETFGDAVELIEYAWRTDAWPFGAIRVEFYNDALQAWSLTEFKLAVAPGESRP